MNLKTRGRGRLLGWMMLCGPLVVLMAGRPVCATNLLDDDFQSYANGTWPATWTQQYNASDLANNGIRLDPVDSGNQVLKLYGLQNWSAGAVRPVTFTDNFIVNARVYNGSEDRTPGWGRGSMGIDGRTTLFTFYSDGTLVGGANPEPYQTERWYDVAAHYQQTGNNVTVDLWLDGAHLGQAAYNVPWLPGDLAGDQIFLNGGSTAYFDNVTVRAIPEPSTLLLLAAGCLTALTWRRPLGFRPSPAS